MSTTCERIPVTPQGCPGKIFRSQKQRSRPGYFVLAGLDPAIHAFGRTKQRRGYAGQARARRLEIVSREPYTSFPCRRNFPGQPCVTPVIGNYGALNRELKDEPGI